MAKSKKQREAEARLLEKCRKLVLAYRYRKNVVYDRKLLFAVDAVVQATEELPSWNSETPSASAPPPSSAL